MKSYRRAFLIRILCLSRLDWHDTGKKRVGNCLRCGLPYNENGHTR